MDLEFDESAFEGIKDAFPGVQIANTKGMYVERRPPDPRISFICMRYAIMENERIIFGTRNGEQVNLKLNCRENLQLSTSPVVLQIRDVTDEDDVGDVALVRFSRSECGFGFQAVCESLILKHKAKVISIDEEPVKIMSQSGKMIQVPGSVKFDTGNDAGTCISHELVEELDLKPDLSKRRRVTGPGGVVLKCFSVEVTLVIRKRKFTRKALLGATAPGTDLLIGMDIIKRLNEKNYTLGE